MSVLRSGILLLCVAAAACGGGASSERIGSTGPRAQPKLAKVKPAAMREFESAMRALRLGGPEANGTARVRLERAVNIDDKLWEGWYDLGVIYYQEGDDEKAIASLSKSLAVNPGHVSARLARAEAHRRSGALKAARGDYEATLRETSEDDPLRSDAAARLASLLRDAKDYNDAISVLREILRVSGSTSRIYTELGLVYLAQGRLELAALVLAKASEIDGKDPGVYNALALLALKQGKAQEAFDRFDHATKLDPNYLDARFNKAAVLLDAGDHVRAKQELSALVERAPDDLGARVALGTALRGLKDLKGAKATWEKVVNQAARKNPARVDALWNLAILKADFLEDVPGGKLELERYMQEASSNHPKRQAAEEKRKELGL